jgi:Zn-dependent peptidase ImmA (M78 family)/transcriptional regulator with XRE-family HTH domain
MMIFDLPAEMQAKAEMLMLVRESLGITQTEVAERMAKLSAASGSPVSQGYVSRAEKGRLVVSGDRLGLYAQALECVPSLLCLDPQVADVGIGLVHHRKKAALAAPALQRIHAQLALTRLHVQNLLQAAEVAADGSRFVRVPVDETYMPFEAAEAVREAWGMPDGPVADLTGWIERAGGLVLRRDLGSDLLDAVSQWPAGRGPLLLVNSRAPGDRLRFSIAHELGHLTMHDTPGETALQERQADEFAAAFLMPEEQIGRDLAGGVGLGHLARLKERWGVSMAALLRRAHTLGALTEWQYRNAMIEMSALGYRTAEPGVVEPEQPTAVRDALAKAVDSGSLTPEVLAERMHLHLEDLRRDYAAPQTNQTTATTEVRP